VLISGEAESMPVFISYSRQDRAFVDSLAKNLVLERHNVWLDRWELNVGDSLIQRIQAALTESSAILVILSKSSVASEWCRKELSSGLVRELSERKVLVLPCVIDDCEIPLFLRDKLYADFRHTPDEAFKQVNDALLRISNNQQGRLDSPDFHTDWSVDWKTDQSGRWYFDWTFVDHSAAIEYCVVSRCQMMCNDRATAAFKSSDEDTRQEYIREAFSLMVDIARKERMKIQLTDAFEKFIRLQVSGKSGQGWFVEISSRRMGIDNGKDTLVHVDQILERTLASMTREERAKAWANSKSKRKLTLRTKQRRMPRKS
jgi:TIR domain-containing protein